MIRAHQVYVRQNAFMREDGTERLVNQIVVLIGDLHLKCDADPSTILLAKRLADEHQAAFYYDEVNAEACRKALKITETEELQLGAFTLACLKL